MNDVRRTRTGALLGAVAGPPLVLLAAYPLLMEPLRASGGGGLGPLWIAAGLASAFVGFVGMPLLGASVVSGAWMGRKPARRLANYLVGASIAVFGLVSLLRWAVPTLHRGAEGTFLSIIRLQVGLVLGVLACYRTRKEDAPA